MTVIAWKAPIDAHRRLAGAALVELKFGNMLLDESQFQSIIFSCMEYADLASAYPTEDTDLLVQLIDEMHRVTVRISEKETIVTGQSNPDTNVPRTHHQCYRLKHQTDKDSVRLWPSDPMYLGINFGLTWHVQEKVKGQPLETQGHSEHSYLICALGCDEPRAFFLRFRDWPEEKMCIASSTMPNTQYNVNMINARFKASMARSSSAPCSITIEPWTRIIRPLLEAGASPNYRSTLSIAVSPMVKTLTPWEHLVSSLTNSDIVQHEKDYWMEAAWLFIKHGTKLDNTNPGNLLEYEKAISDILSRKRKDTMGMTLTHSKGKSNSRLANLFKWSRNKSAKLRSGPSKNPLHGRK
ncbi:uncharacterized protein BDZ99DRAFT_528047 [Mytilinidion resinicola]|uniref:Uncharacterized protein n=1 Tax=Mytilinidion resinicola TaxID=574789 RepID=A0A6A6XZZ1_9PEZI|nr:uncharacterized protein BDZ99DRAFT_528047 [Mytilinidion resinicola]KAF2801833.1 hypothetical protein BDZ99DRAFT_528047 [Mytilinidion resinicola]